MPRGGGQELDGCGHEVELAEPLGWASRHAEADPRVLAGQLVSASWQESRSLVIQRWNELRPSAGKAGPIRIRVQVAAPVAATGP